MFGRCDPTDSVFLVEKPPIVRESLLGLQPFSGVKSAGADKRLFPGQRTYVLMIATFVSVGTKTAETCGRDIVLKSLFTVPIQPSIIPCYLPIEM